MKVLVKLGLLSAMVALSSPAQALMFGENTAGSSSISYGNQGPATQFSCNETGTVNYILFYISSLAGGETGRAAIYNSRDDGSGRETPNVLLNQSSSQTLVSGWNTFAVSGTAVNNGTIYWLCLLTSAGTVSIAGYTDSMGKSRYSAGVITTFPDPYPSASSAAFRISIYATDVLPSPTPTATRTATMTSTATAAPTASNTPTTSPTPTASLTVSGTPTSGPTSTASPTATETPTSGPTSAASSTAVITPTATATPTQTAAPENPLRLADLGDKAMLACPNPAQDRMTFVFNLDSTAKVEIRLYNLAGEQVTTLSGDFAAGRGQSLAWDLKDVAPGVYVARMLVNSSEKAVLKAAVKK